MLPSSNFRKGKSSYARNSGETSQRYNDNNDNHHSPVHALSPIATVPTTAAEEVALFENEDQHCNVSSKGGGKSVSPVDAVTFSSYGSGTNRDSDGFEKISSPNAGISSLSSGQSDKRCPASATGIHVVKNGACSSCVSDSDGPIIVIATMWAKREMEERALLTSNLRTVMVLQQPGVVWTEQGVYYKGETNSMQRQPTSTTPRDSRLQIMMITSWRTYGQFRTFFLSPESMKFYVDNVEIIIQGTFEIDQFIPIRVRPQCESSEDTDVNPRKRRLTHSPNTQHDKDSLPCNEGEESCRISNKMARTLQSQEGAIETNTSQELKNEDNQMQKCTCMEATQRIKERDANENEDSYTYPISPFNAFLCACIVIRIYPDSKHISEVMQLIDSADVSSREFKRQGMCFRFETCRPYRSEKPFQEFFVYAVYATADHFHQHLAAMGEDSLLGDKMKQLSIKQPVCEQFRANPVTYEKAFCLPHGRSKRKIRKSK